ncbi:hypothetical protein KIF59_03555 [Enterobacter cloacae subsp. cloacae]|nr:hypothetical protein [Enterobacter cloacae subsp. cloacae]
MDFTDAEQAQEVKTAQTFGGSGRTFCAGPDGRRPLRRPCGKQSLRLLYVET